ncbi:MAG: DUF86 domain-containing protein [Caldisericia bacterium]
MKRSAELYIKDIIEYMERAENHILGFTYSQFLDDIKTCDAIIRCIEVIGEAAKNIPEDIKNKFNMVPWRDIAGMRDKIIHGYFSIDFEEVWLTVKEDIPKIKPLIKKVLDDLKKIK